MAQWGHQECECIEQLKELKTEINEKDVKIEELKDSIDELKTLIKEMGESKRNEQSLDNSNPANLVRRYDYNNFTFEDETHEAKPADWIAMEISDSPELPTG